MDKIVNGLTSGAEWFISLFNRGGEQFIGLITGVLPTLIVLMIAINSLIKIVGEERVNKAAKVLAKNYFTRYTLLPVLSVFFLGNPMCYSFGKFLDQDYKIGFYDATVSFLHPVTGLFPHANPGELFIWLGISVGLEEIGVNTTSVALWYFLVGIVVIFIRGVVTERIYMYLYKNKRQEKELNTSNV